MRSAVRRHDKWNRVWTQQCYRVETRTQAYAMRDLCMRVERHLLLVLPCLQRLCHYPIHVQLIRRGALICLATSEEGTVQLQLPHPNGAVNARRQRLGALEQPWGGLSAL